MSGVAIVFAVLSSAVRTVVVPRGERPLLSTLVITPTRAVFNFFAAHTTSEESRERVLARFAPTSLLLLPLAWAVGVMVGFIPIYWALDVEPREAVVFSGSSLTTLGFSRPGEMPAIIFAFLEALIGLALVALLISFLPTIYGHFSAREKAVTRLETRAGSPPDPVEMLTRTSRIGILEEMTEIWEEWEHWFIDLEESHTSFPTLVWFRSPVVGRSWVTSAGTTLDAAALAVSTLAIENQWRAQLFMRTGYLSLRRVGDFFDVPYDPEPLPTAPISISQDEYNEVYELLAAAGLPLKPDREQCWKDFAGWRVNYDAVLLGMCGIVNPPEAKWSSDRAEPVRIPIRLRAVNRSID
jgi:hypothetical protein